MTFEHFLGNIYTKKIHMKNYFPGHIMSYQSSHEFDSNYYFKLQTIFSNFQTNYENRLKSKKYGLKIRSIVRNSFYEITTYCMSIN